MKRFLLPFVGIILSCSLVAQTATEWMAKAQVFTQQADYENAISTLQKARLADPQSIEPLNKLSFVYFLQRDFAKAIETGKIAIAQENADQQSFQILGLSYKAIASYREASKIYQQGLKKFPAGGLIYNEYGENLALDGNLPAAIGLWEQGIEKDPNYSGNYYNAVRYYEDKNEISRLCYYAEIFVNLESYSGRTTEVKKILAKAYSKVNGEKGLGVGEFTEMRLSLLSASPLKTRTPSLPGVLEARWSYLRDNKLFEAYNYWLLEEAIDKAAFAGWITANDSSWQSFKTFQQARVFKIPKA